MGFSHSESKVDEMVASEWHTDIHEDVMARGLFQALLGDGFAAWSCGPKDNPTAMVCFYEWPDYLDVVTVPSQGPAAAARLAKPADAMDPPDTAVWAWVGEPEPTIWALLNLPHPDHPDAPVADVATPDELRVPRELRDTLTLRKPDEDKAGVRARRLAKEMAEPKRISQQFLGDLFDEVDAKGAIAAAENFTADGTFVFANFPPMTGRTAIAAFVMTLFTRVSTVKHEMHNYWRAGCDAITNGEVTFTRHDGTVLKVPFATISTFSDDGNQLIEHQVYVDASALNVRTPEPLWVAGRS